MQRLSLKPMDEQSSSIATDEQPSSEHGYALGSFIQDAIEIDPEEDESQVYDDDAEVFPRDVHDHIPAPLNEIPEPL